MKEKLIFFNNMTLTDFLNSMNGYEVRNEDIFYEKKLVGRIFTKDNFYDNLEELGIDWKSIISQPIFPDTSIFLIESNTLFIIEYKVNHNIDSTYLALQSCDFNKKQYQKLLTKVNIHTEYIFVLNSVFQQTQHKDILSYTHDTGSHYFFESLPLTKIGMPYQK